MKGLAVSSQFSPSFGVGGIVQRMPRSSAESHRHMAVVGVVSMETFQQHDITSTVTFKLFRAFWISGIT